MHDSDNAKKRPKSSKGDGKKSKGAKEGKEKGKGKEEDKGQKESTSEGEATAPAVQSAGRHFVLNLNEEEDRAMACLLADHELEVCTGLICYVVSCAITQPG